MKHDLIPLRSRAIAFLMTKSTVVVFCLLCLVLIILHPEFLSSTNLTNVARQITMNAIIAAGMTLVLLSGEIDLSVGSVVALTGVLVGMAMQAGVPVPLAFVIGLSIGLAVGFINGLAVTRFKIPFFITTLAMMIIVRGVSYLLTGGMPVAGFPVGFLVLGQGFVGPVPVPILLVLLVYGAGAYVLNQMRFGRYLYAIGGNAEAARLSGINVNSHRIAVYMICGAMASLSGMVLMARLDSGQPTAGEGYELDAIAAVVIGGTKLTGGEGGLLGTLLGALILGVLSNGLNLLDVSPYWQYILKGSVILIAVAPILTGSNRARATP